MFTTTPPPAGPPGPGGSWGLRRAVRLEFPRPAALARDRAHGARLGGYLTDVLAPFGLRLGGDEPGRTGQSYGEMAGELIGLAVPADDPVDLLVLAYAIPDSTPGRATATYLSHVCPGGPMAFAVSDQGTAAAFTGLRLIREYARGGGLRRGLLLVVEQAELPYDPGVPVTVPSGNTGVALVFGDADDTARPGGGDQAGDRLRPLPVTTSAVRVGFPDEGLADAVGALAPPAAAGTVAILGAGLTARGCRPTGLNSLRLASPGRPATGVWWELAGLLARPGRPAGRLVLADFEAASRSLCLAVFDVVGAGNGDEEGPES